MTNVSKVFYVFAIVNTVMLMSFKFGSTFEAYICLI